MTRFAEWWQANERGEPRLYVVAEMANAHDGSLDRAMAIVAVAASAGADAIKFQCFTAAELLVRDHSMFETFQRLQMPDADWRRLIETAAAAGLDVFADVFGLASTELMANLGVTGFKVHLSDIGNQPLLRAVGTHGRPVLLSTGGASEAEVEVAVAWLQEHSVPLVLLHGVQLYPTAVADSALLRVTALAERFRLPTGYAGHVDGGSAEAMWLPLVAAGAGARLLETHVTQDRAAQGTDYYSSLDPDVFRRFVESARLVEQGLGAATLTISTAEQTYRAGALKAPVAAVPIAKGMPLTDENLTFKRVPDATNPPSAARLAGRKAGRDLAADEPITEADLAPADRPRVYATLACRIHSARLYAKPLQYVGDRPILKHLIDRLSLVRAIDGMVLAISEGADNAVFVECAHKWGLPYVVGDEADVLGRHIQAAHSVDADIVVRVTTENPFVYQEMVDELIERHVAAGADLTVGELLPDGAYAEVINVAALEEAHRSGEDRHRSELCTLYIFENPDRFKIQRIAAPDEAARPDIRLTIDTPEDLMLARSVYEALEPEFGPMPPLVKIIRYLDAHPAIRQLNIGFSTTKLWK